MILFLDDHDERAESFKRFAPKGHVIVVKTAKECIETLAGQEWNIVFLDHDLEDTLQSEDNNGMTVVRWIVENNPFIRQIIVHSNNKPAADNMVIMLQKASYIAAHIPFTTLITNLRKANRGI
jgi:DNA-binding NarL/FixJ family response regulator